MPESSSKIALTRRSGTEAVRPAPDVKSVEQIKTSSRRVGNPFSPGPKFQPSRAISLIQERRHLRLYNIYYIYISNRAAVLENRTVLLRGQSH
jgi:hypothetical protein